jgi:DNA-binding NtrC family response regulator
MADESQLVLLVDDEPALLRMMHAYLKRLGFAVVSFGHTDKAAEYARANSGAIRLAVLDLTMKGMSAIDLGRELLAANPDLHLILASGYTADISQLESAGPGRVSYLQKPFSPEMLLGTVRQQIG